MQGRQRRARGTFWIAALLSVWGPGCGDDDPSVITPGQWESAAGSGAGAGAGGRRSQSCGRAQLARVVDARLAASICVGIRFAPTARSEVRCQPAPVPDPRAAGLLFCVIPDAKFGYVVSWTSTTNAEAIADGNRFIATVRKSSPNAYHLDYFDGSQGRCTITGTQLDFCIEEPF